MKKILNYMLIVLGTVLLTYSCKPSDYYYGEYLKNGEIYYPGRVDSLSIIPGNQRGILRFKVTTDPKVNSVRVYLRSSLSPTAEVKNYPIEASEHGKIKLITLDGLSEATYTANVYSFTNQGDSSRSVASSQFIYGQSYIRTLVNRSFSKFDKANANEHFLVLARENNLPRQGTFYPMQFTEVTYRNNSGDSTTVRITPYEDFASLKNIASPSTVKYRTVYKPVQASIDYFYTAFTEQKYSK